MIAGAAANLAANRLSDLCLGWVGIPIEQGSCGHHHPGGTEPTLQAVALNEAFLHGVEDAIRLHAFDGSDMIKFNTRSSIPGEGTYHDSDLEQVSYQVLAEEDGSLTLFRWSSPGQELGSDMTFPLLDDNRNHIVAEGLGSFSLRFLDNQGEWLPGWDSTQIEESEELPDAIEIDISMWTDEDLDEWESGDERHYIKQVVLHQRPLDMAKMIEARDLALAEQAGGAGLAQGQLNAAGQRDPSGDGSENASAEDEFFGGGAATPGSVAECTRQNWGTCVDRYGEGNCGVWANVTQVPVQAFGIDLPWCQ